MKKWLAIALCALMLFCGLTAHADGMLTGGWTATEDAAVTEEARTALDKALEGFVGSNIEPVALLGTQLVAGMNYAILCRVTPVVPNAVPHYAVVYVYSAPDGSASILEIADMELGLSPAEDAAQ